MIGAILVGGASSRFGTDKASVIGPRVLDALRAADLDPIVAVGGTPGVLPVPTVADRYPGEGPLGAVATALTYARRGRVLVVACDLPLLDQHTIRAVLDRLDTTPSTTALVASTNGVLHPSLACWPAGWARAAHRAIGTGERRFRHLLELGPVEAVEVDPRSLDDADDEKTLRSLLSNQAANADPDMTDPSPSEA